MGYQDRYPRTRNGRRHPLDCVSDLGWWDAAADIDDCPYDHPVQRAAWMIGWNEYHESDECPPTTIDNSATTPPSSPSPP